MRWRKGGRRAASAPASSTAVAILLGIVVLFTPAIWFITDRLVEPRLGAWKGEVDAETRAELERGVKLLEEAIESGPELGAAQS